MIKDIIIEYLNNKEEVTMDKILIECFGMPVIKGYDRKNRINIGKIIKSMGWYRYKDKYNNWYYTKNKRLTWEETMLNNTCK